MTKKSHLMMAALAAIFAAITWSCDKEEDPSLSELREDKLAYLEDSLRISDSLQRINAAGVVNYAITIVSGSTSSLFKNDEFFGGRSQQTKSAIDGAIVTISQFGKTQTDTTDESGMVVFNGFFRSSVNISVRKEGFTKVSYISVLNSSDATENNKIYFVGNIIPLFELSGENTSTIKGRATIQTNLTNKTRELVPDGTKVSASIDASSGDFAYMFLTSGINANGTTPSGDNLFYVGKILDASYETNVIGTVTNGNYSITVPAAVNGLPMWLDFSDIAADQTLFETAGVVPGDRTATYRTIFSPYTGSVSSIPSASGVSITFESFTSAATATAVVSGNAGTIDRINVTNGGSGYNSAAPPVVEIVGGGGSGATATAVVDTNGKVTGITLTNAGSGYTSAPSANIISGSGALASAGLQINGTVTGVTITNSGLGYTAAPTVTFSAPALATGVTATGTATIDAAGRVTSIAIVDAGSGYNANPTVTLSAAPAGGVNASASGIYSGQSVAEVTISSGGTNYTSAPTVVFSAPQRSNGVRATGTAVINASTRQVVGITVNNAGSGYTSAPSITINSGSGAATEVWLTGGSVISADISSQGSGYAYAPIVTFTGGGGQGAAATAVLADGKVVGLNITNGGTGYLSPPTVTFSSGDNAVAYATITNGAISAITVSDGGRNFTGVPRVVISSTTGGGATGTATVANGAITGVNVVSGGSGYLEGNVPSSPEFFSASNGSYIYTRPGMDYINDVHYGTGLRQPN